MTTDAGSARWLNNKTWVLIIIFIASLTFYSGRLLPPIIKVDSQIETRLVAVERLAIKQEVISTNLATTLDRIQLDLREGFREIKADMRLYQTKQSTFGYSIP